MPKHTKKGTKAKRAAEAATAQAARDHIRQVFDDYSDEDYTQVDYSSSIEAIALCHLDSAHSALSLIEDKPEWTLADTSSFDHLHHGGEAALESCALTLGLDEEEEEEPVSDEDEEPFYQMNDEERAIEEEEVEKAVAELNVGDEDYVIIEPRHILEIGSGFNSTGRYLASKYNVEVTGFEVHPEQHDLAEVITARNEDEWVRERVRSMNVDLMKVNMKKTYQIPEDDNFIGFDHIICLFQIMHLSKDDRIDFLQRAYELLKPNGRMYIEDYYHRKQTTKDERAKLRNVLSCSYLPTLSNFIADATDADFDDPVWDDVTVIWAPVVKARAEEYRKRKDKKKELELLYDTVAELFESGNIGGVKLTLRKPHPDENKTEAELEFEQTLGVTLEGQVKRMQDAAIKAQPRRRNAKGAK